VLETPAKQPIRRAFYTNSPPEWVKRPPNSSSASRSGKTPGFLHFFPAVCVERPPLPEQGEQSARRIARHGETAGVRDVLRPNPDLASERLDAGGGGVRPSHRGGSGFLPIYHFTLQQHYSHEGPIYHATLQEHYNNMYKNSSPVEEFSANDLSGRRSSNLALYFLNVSSKHGSPLPTE
jgi:hypothetical protein